MRIVLVAIVLSLDIWVFDMPWKPSDAQKKTKKANTPKEKKQWASVANKVLKSTGDESKAVKIANASVKKRGK